MSTVPRVSVVTVAFNDLENVKKTLDSLRAQSLKHDWEHVLIDGGSTDGTPGWYETAGLAVPTVLISERDDGIFDAMNKAVDVAAGDYVVYLNAGDTYADSDVLSRLIVRLSDAPEWGYGRANVVDEQGRVVRRSVGMVPYSRRKHLLGRATICHQAVAMRRSFLRDLGGFDKRLGTAGDYHLLLRAAAISRPRSWREIDVNYLTGGVSDRGVYAHLWRRHDARVDALRLNSAVRPLDGLWTALQVCQVAVRKTLKPLLKADR